MKKRVIIITIISFIALIFIILGIVLSKNNNVKKENQIKIIDATITCSETTETFYENDEYIYMLPCANSSSLYVKLSNGNKMLVIDALEEGKVTINELIDAGLNVNKIKK